MTSFILVTHTGFTLGGRLAFLKMGSVNYHGQTQSVISDVGDIGNVDFANNGLFYNYNPDNMLLIKDNGGVWRARVEVLAATFYSCRLVSTTITNCTKEFLKAAYFRPFTASIAKLS